MPILTQPAIGSTSWGTQMNTNLQVLQTQLTNAMQGRIGYVSTTSIRLDRYTGDTVEVNGLNVSIGSSGITLNTTDDLIDASGNDAGSGMAASTLYYVYLSNANASYAPSSLRASLTQYTNINGVRYLAASGNGANWRFVGWVKPNSSTLFEDNTTNRLVINYFNRRPLALKLTPGYVDDNMNTTYTVTKATWGSIKGSGDTASLIANGEDLLDCTIVASVQPDANGISIGIGIDSTSQPSAGSARFQGTNIRTVRLVEKEPEGYHTVNMIAATNGGTTTVYADTVREGAASDPATTYLTGYVMG